MYDRIIIKKNKVKRPLQRRDPKKKYNAKQ